ncbi:Uma2 family endonuclease [Altericista sp. CCNU0014]|uniref:Uma2 family endonuclease n=1 Tax=Altericista sp. CCNU0014 TaxID=3082949 RepID=UPI00384FB15F
MTQSLSTSTDAVSPEYPDLVVPDISDLVIEDDTPVDNLISEKQQRLLTEPLYSAQDLFKGRSFLASANVGVFYALRRPPLVPDVFLSLNVEPPQDFKEKKNRTYFVWEFGKPPDVVIEIVSNKEGNELGYKLTNYAQMGVTYYIVYDPLQQLGQKLLYAFGLREGQYLELERLWLPQVGLGLTLWQGAFEEVQGEWLRWCDETGAVITTGAERAEQEHQRAEQEHQRAEQEHQRAEAAERRVAELLQQMQTMNIQPIAGLDEASER